LKVVRVEGKIGWVPIFFEQKDDAWQRVHILSVSRE